MADLLTRKLVQMSVGQEDKIEGCRKECLKEDAAKGSDKEKSEGEESAKDSGGGAREWGWILGGSWGGGDTSQKRKVWRIHQT